MWQELYASMKIWSIWTEYPLEKGLICDEQQKELKNKNSLLKTLIDNKDSGHTINDSDDVSLILKDDKIYIPDNNREI